MKNGTATGNDNINIESLKAGEDTISKTLAKLYSKCLSERRIPTAWKNTTMVIIFKKWSLQTCDGPRHRLTGNDSEKNLAENILRPGLILSHSASHSSTTRKPSTQCKLKQYWPGFKNRGRKRVRRTHERNLHQQLDDSPPTHRKQQDEHQEREEYDREIPYRPSCLRQHSKTYSNH